MGDGYVAVIVALAVGYLFAACVVFRQPSPFSRSRRVGGGAKAKRRAAAGAAAAADDDNYPAPMPKGDMTVGELKRFDGKDPSLPVLIAAKGRIYDVTRGRDFYGERAPSRGFFFNRRRLRRTRSFPLLSPPHPNPPTNATPSRAHNYTHRTRSLTPAGGLMGWSDQIRDEMDGTLRLSDPLI